MKLRKEEIEININAILGLISHAVHRREDELQVA